MTVRPAKWRKPATGLCEYIDSEIHLESSQVVWQFMQWRNICNFILEEEIVILVLVTIGKTLINGGFVGIYVITAEMFSSDMRTAAISILNSSGKILGMMTPFIAYLVCL